MKTIKKIVLALVAVCTMLSIVTVQVAADTVYIVDGYSYNILTNETIAICGWDNSSSEFVVPDSITGRKVFSIANKAFYGNQEITTVDFSAATELWSIGYQSFYKCTNLISDILLPSSVESLGISAFEGCSSITSVDIQGSVSFIPAQCFYKCSSLATLTLSDGVESIDKFAFANCPSLEYVELSRNVISISPYAFKNDSNLTLGVYYNSYAHQYATENNIPYVLVDGVKLGDADRDGVVSINDVTLIQRHLAELETLEGIYLYAADANRDGVLDISDATAIQMFLANFKVPYPIDEIITA